MKAFFDKSEVERLLAERFITARRHPSLPLTIYNYTLHAQFTPPAQWGEQLQWCRGLIVDDDGQVIGAPFKKFWNYEQVREEIPQGENFTVWEKLDGSLGIVCEYSGQLVTATRGAFDSWQARFAREWLSERQFLPRSGLTYLFEIIAPENRIVVDYGERSELVLLAVRDASGERDDIFATAEAFTKAKLFDGLRDFGAIDAVPEFRGEEGFVVRWQSGFRAKLKLAEYQRLHKLLTQCSNRTIWEHLRAGTSLAELTDRTPAEFQAWLNEQVVKLKEAHREVREQAARDFEPLKTLPSRKEFAEAAKKMKYPGLLFSLLDGKDITDPVWRLVEPKWEKPFRRDDEG